MYAIIGAAGNVGFATSKALRQANAPVRAIVRDDSKAEKLRNIGCEIAVADLQDANALTKAIGDAETVQVILPPSFQADIEDIRKTMKSLVAALKATKPKRFLAISDYGAHVAHDIGMPSIYHDFEEHLRPLPSQKIFLRTAEYFQNFVRVIPAAIGSSVFPTFHEDVERRYPNISAPDLGAIAAEILLQPAGTKDLEIIHAEGPRRYSATDVATALSELLGKPVTAQSVPREQWRGVLEQGLHPDLATLIIKSQDAQNEGSLVDVEENVGEVRYGTTDLIDALRPLVPRG